MALGPTIVARFLADTRQLTGALDSAEAEGRSKLAGLGKAAAAMGTAFAVAGAVDFAGKAISQASDLEESISKVNQVFKAGGDEIVAWSKTAADSLGLSQGAALKAVGTFGNLAVSLGLPQAQATDMSQKLVELGADLGSFNNVPVDDALAALKSGLTGETEPLKAFGVNINDAALKAKALQLGLVSSTVDLNKLSSAQETSEKASRKAADALKQHGQNSVEFKDAARDSEQAQSALAAVMEGKVPASLTAAEKAQASYALIMEQTGLAQGDFARTSDGLANATKTAGAKFEELQASVGAKLLPVMTFLVSFLADTVIPAISGLFSAIGNSEAFQSFSSFITGTLVPAFQTAVEWIKQFVFPAVAQFFESTLVPALKSVADWLSRVAAPAVTDWFQNQLIPALQDVAKWITETLIPAVVEMGKAISESGAFQAFKTALEGVGPLIESIASFVTSTLLPALVSLAGWFNENKDVLAAILIAIGTALTLSVLPALITTFAVWVAGAVTAAGATLIAAAPWIILGAIIAGIALVIIKNWDTIMAAVTTAIDFIRPLFEFLLPIVTAPFRILMEIVQAVFPVIMGIIGGVISWVTNNWSTLFLILTLPIQTAVKIITFAWETIKEGVTAVWRWITDKWNAIGDAIRAAVDKVGGYINTMVDFLKKPMAAATEVFNWVSEKFQKLADFLRGLVSSIGDTAGRIADAIKKPINAVIDFWNGLQFNVPQVTLPSFDLPGIGQVGGGTIGGQTFDFPDIPKLAKGGVLTDPTLFLGGERGTEIVSPEDLLRAIVSEESGGRNYTMNVYPRTANVADVAQGFRRLEIMAGLP
jgi:phage-related protein